MARNLEKNLENNATLAMQQQARDSIMRRAVGVHVKDDA